MHIVRFDRVATAAVLAALLGAAPFAWGQDKLVAPLRAIPIKVGSHALKVEVADSDTSRARGLMYRQKLGKDDGMLFIFPDPGYHSMWMMNTYIPLSVAFVDADGRILNVLDMEPQTLDTHTAAGPARYAIETNKGWFARKKIKAGDSVTGLPTVK